MSSPKCFIITKTTLIIKEYFVKGIIRVGDLNLEVCEFKF